MNERIRELAERAGMTDDKFGMFFAKDKHDEDGVDLEKFAELIVLECIQVCLSRRDPPNLNYKPSVAFADELRLHFGVFQARGWVCPKCGIDRAKEACPNGHHAALTGHCPMIGVAQ